MSEKIALTINEAVSASGLGRTTIYQLIKRGELPFVKIGARTLIRARDLDQMLERSVRQNRN